MRKLALTLTFGLAITTCFADGTKPKATRPAATKCTDKSCCKKPGNSALMKAKKKV